MDGKLRNVDLGEEIKRRKRKTKLIKETGKFKSKNIKNLNSIELVLKAKHRRKINLDISARCPLQCPRCRRQTILGAGEKIPGFDMRLEEFELIVSHFNYILFCGQVSDPTAHPLFHDFLRRCNEERKYTVQSKLPLFRTTVATAASHRSKDWYREAFELNPTAVWRFGLDGFPHESSMYRINQDGEKLWDIMLMGIDMGITIEQQCIVFSYNEDHIDEVQNNAVSNGITFLKMYSSRWLGEDDPLIPRKTQGFIRNSKKQKMVDSTPWIEERWLGSSSLCPR